MSSYHVTATAPVGPDAGMTGTALLELATETAGFGAVDRADLSRRADVVPDALSRTGDVVAITGTTPGSRSWNPPV